ncbi:MAG TPA: amino acid adenylation domain-containing protein [Thermoanaerobaculia bacterium]|nr:amino acid adenylation domain-containing protein [Thermoanaerobaculia bacterium]
MGRPVANTRLHVVDRLLRPTPLGVPGELLLAGVQVAVGYLDRPAMTAEKFIPDGFPGGEPGARVYRTGDLVRWRAGGEVEFLGRIDFQVKIRGLRIELGEIETCLSAQPQIRAAVVVARPGPSGAPGSGDLSLVAYFVPADEALIGCLALGEMPAPAALGTYLAPVLAALAQKLPAHMVPTLLVPMLALPLGPTGKVDRKALPEPAAVLGRRERAFEPPTTPVEQVLAGIFQEVLGVERVGIHDSFFALGGHSLKATQVQLRIQSAFGIELPLRRLFESPTVAGLALTVAELLLGGEEVDFAALLAELEAEGAEGAEEAAPPPSSTPVQPERIERRGEAVGPASFGQERLWFLSRLEPDNPAYNLSAGVRLSGALDVAALAATLAAVVERHEVLRTVYAESGGESIQRVLPPFRPALPLVDLGGLSPSLAQALAGSLAAQRGRHPFNLERGPVLRALLLRTAAAEHVLILELHHVATDGWSMGILVREVASLYGAARSGQAAALAPLPVQYLDFARWQRRNLSGERLARLAAWWREELAEAPPQLELPTDRPRPAGPSPRAAYLPLRLGAAGLAALTPLERQAGATRFMTLVAALGVVLSRFSGQGLVVVGTPIAGRRLTEIEPLIGFFVNTLALAVRVDERASFADLLRGVARLTLDAFAHQDLPFEKLVEELQPARNPASTPIFQAVLVLQNMPFSRAELPGLVLSHFEVPTGAAKYDLTLGLGESVAGLSGKVEYRAELFDQATIERLVAHLELVLGGAASEPERPLALLPRLTAADQAQLASWNANALDFSDRAPQHEQFALQAAARPDALAIADGEVLWSYGELEARGCRLARWLAGQGVGRESVVAVVCERSPELVLAELAVWKAGGAYLPCDPAHPPERLAIMLEDARTPLVLTQSHLLSRLAESGRPLVALDDPAGAWCRETEESPEPWSLPIDLDQIALLIYTSGSTGKPKGAALAHRGLIGLCTWHVVTHAVTAADRSSMVAGPGFDASAWDIWPHLASGASLWVPPAGSVLDPPRLAAWMAAARITVCFLPTPLAELMVAGEPTWGVWRDLRVLTSGGDRLRLRPAAPGRVLHNQYGPSETTIVVTDEPVGHLAAPGDEGRILPIGRPMPNHSMWVVDREGRLLPLGAPGELLIGGPGLARGYHRRPRLTAERFLPDGCSGRSGARLYKTGDLVRWLPDGRLDFLGRIDFQVKIRGQRVELGEIEACLTACPEVAAATLLTWPGPGGSLSLAAYVVPRDPARPASEWLAAVKAALTRQLPAYMVPADFIPLDALPQTPNGKIDRRALPAPFSAHGAGFEEVVPPRTALEAKVAAIFGEVLGRADVGALDDFFSLGGHSLLATRLASRVRDAFGVELELRRVFAAPTVAGLAGEIETAQSRETVPLEASADTEGPLSFGQERLWFLSRFEPDSPAYNVGAAVRLAGRLDVAGLASTLAEVVARHAVLRTVFVQVGDEMRQRVLPRLAVPLPVVDLGALAAGEREARARALAAREAARPFDVERGPVVRFLLLRLEPGDHVLSALMHHIASDGWSVGILVAEIAALYGGTRVLPPLPVQYLDYARWQRRTVTGERLAELVTFWRDALAGAPGHLDLPTDRPRPPVASPASAALAVRLPAERLAGLVPLERRSGATRFMTLLAAFDVVLSRWSGQRTVVVGTPIAGRRHTEVEGLIGFFVNTLALPVRVEEDGSFADLLRAVADSTLAAYAHQDLPFERLVEELQPRRSLATTPIFQVLLALQNTPVTAATLPGVTLSPFETGSLAAKFDLNLALSEVEEGLGGALEYRRELWDAATLERLLGHFERVLAGAAADPERPLAALSLLGEEEVAQLAAWNETARSYPEAAPLGELIERQVDRTPEAVALAFEDEQWSYAFLDGRANALARELVGEGVGPGVTVGVLAERSLELVLALVAVEKAGGAYVPLDPDYPEARLAGMIEDARPAVVLGKEVPLSSRPEPEARSAGEGGPSASLGATSGPVVLAFGADSPTSPKRLAPRADLDTPAYVIFTSGSTGKPKGTVNSHRGIANRLLWMQETFHLGPGDRVLQKTPASFDVSVWEFFWPLMTGAKLVVAAPGGHRDPVYLLRTLAERQVTTLHFVPSMLAALLDASDLSGLASVRRVMASGEALPAELVARFHRRVSASELHNLYGPTEAAVDVTWWPCARGDGRPSVPIGRPVANTRLHVVDRRLRPTPLGVPGELLLAGVQVGGGYLGRAALTAEKFLPDGFPGGEAGARVYRTGDLARLRPAGSGWSGGEVEFLGRIDFQVKVRGLRIELGEIEATLAEQPAVRAAAVLARPDAGGELALVAYLVPADEALAGRLAAGQALSAAEQRAWLEPVVESLRGRLPTHMVPAAWVPLASLPLSANGKLDRKALPEPGAPAGAAERPYEPPRTAVEETLAGIFAEVLGLPRVGIHDHFFERGGHSLKASQVQLRLVTAFGVEVPLRRIFETPTVAGLAVAVAEQLLGAEGEEDLAALLAELEE